MGIGENIKRLRKIKGIGQGALAKKTKLSWTSMSLYESGKREPSPANAKAIAEALGVPLSELWGEPAALHHANPGANKRMSNKAISAQIEAETMELEFWRKKVKSLNGGRLELDLEVITMQKDYWKMAYIKLTQDVEI